MAIKKIEALVEKYILLDLLLFKIVSNPDKEATVLAIPEVWLILITLSFKSVCRTSGSDKAIFNDKQ